MLTYEEKMLGKIMHIKEEDIDLKRMLALMEAHKKYPEEYKTFRRMKSRATDPNHPKYSQGYGERGMCEEWLAPYGFLDFMKEVGPKPSYEKCGKVAKWSIDRIDNTKGYVKGNCRWATQEQQMRNRSNTRWVYIDGEKMLAIDACTKYGTDISVFRARSCYGWSDEKAIKTPVKNRRKNNDKIETEPINPATGKPYPFGIQKYAVKGDRLELIGEVQWI